MEALLFIVILIEIIIFIILFIAKIIFITYNASFFLNVVKKSNSVQLLVFEKSRGTKLKLVDSVRRWVFFDFTRFLVGNKVILE